MANKKKTARKGSKKPKNDQNATHRTIRVLNATYDNAQALLDKAAEGGWASFGAKRSDRPTLGSIIDEALKTLAQRNAVPAKLRIVDDPETAPTEATNGLAHEDDHGDTYEPDDPATA